MNHPIDPLRQRLRRGECVILDGAIGTELQRHTSERFALSDDTHWGFDALENHSDVVREVHRDYVAAGCHILTTNTYSILSAPGYPAPNRHHRPDPAHWMNLARQAVRHARDAIAQGAGSSNSVAVAFSIGGDVISDDDVQTIDLLARVFETDPPDLLLFETVSMVGRNRTLETVARLIQAGWPIWVSFRRCRQGACGIHGQIWGGPEGDRFGRLARQLEQAGVEAVLINCLPMDRIQDTIAWLRDFTDVPLGVYPNLGRAIENGWRFADDATRESFVEEALGWRAQGASIIGGCCGVGPADIRLLAHRLEGTPAGRAAPQEALPASANHSAIPAWRDSSGRSLYPLPLPKLQVDKGVFMPTQGSYLIWKFLFRENIGKDLRCLDIGCGAGILSVQLALNGATNVTAIDINRASVENTEVNAFRNGVADRVEGITNDLYTFNPETPYDVIVASLYQMPTNPTGNLSGHRDVDYWGRNLLDHFILQLPHLLARSGVAYVMQVSMLGAGRTTELLDENGYRCRVLDFNLYQFNTVTMENLPQIRTVESLSDAYHFELDRDEHVMVMYLVEITPQP